MIFAGFSAHHTAAARDRPGVPSKYTRLGAKSVQNICNDGGHLTWHRRAIWHPNLHTWTASSACARIMVCSQACATVWPMDVGWMFLLRKIKIVCIIDLFEGLRPLKSGVLNTMCWHSSFFHLLIRLVSEEYAWMDVRVGSPGYLGSKWFKIENALKCVAV